ncbi:MAG: prenyltransferase/squalene oxidase repeat-containing protein [Phycisphaerales bacterium]
MEGEITPELTAAVDRGLAALASMQNDDGSFGQGRFSKNVAVTSLACLAFMSDGHVPGRGRYGPVVDKGLRYVLSCCSETGLIAGESVNGPMYGHGFATLFLGEVYGMTQGGGDTAQADRVHDALVKACTLIERTQNDEGGWRYNPVPFDADVSVTICQIMGLRRRGTPDLKSPRRRSTRRWRTCVNASCPTAGSSTSASRA